MLTVNLTNGRNKRQCPIVYIITAYEKKLCDSVDIMTIGRYLKLITSNQIRMINYVFSKI